MTLAQNLPLKVAVVGTGGIGIAHIRCWMNMLPKAKIVTVVDEREDIAAHAAQIAGNVPYYTHLEDMLDSEEVDIVDICTPPFVHRDQIILAAKAHKHILCEKPLTVELNDADEVIQVCREAKVKLMTAFCIPYYPLMRKLKNVIKNEQLGKPIRIYATEWMRSEWLQKPTGWFWDPKKSGGTTIEGIIHLFHLLPWFFGKVKRVYAEGGSNFIYTTPPFTLPDDQIVVLLSFSNGAIGIIDGGANAPSNFEQRMNIFFTEGGIEVKREKMELLGGGTIRIYKGIKTYVDWVKEYHVEGEREIERYARNTGGSPTAHIFEIEHFIDSILENKTPETPGEDGRSALEYAWAAIKSLRTHNPVDLPLSEPYPSYK